MIYQPRKFAPHFDFTTKFSHPCRGPNTTLCDACREKEDLEFEDNIIPGLACTDRSVAFELARANRSVQNENHDPIILRLPPEVACRIFELCMPELADPYDGRLGLGWICQGWRRLALATPMLWTRIAIRLSSDLRFEPQFSEEFLRRAGDLPLSIHVYDHVRFGDGDREFSQYSKAEALIHLVNSFSHRWEILKFQHLSNEYIPMFKGNGQGSPMLHHLMLHSDYFEGDEGLNYFSLGNSTPTPEKLLMSRLPLLSVNISYANLRTVILENVRNAGLLFDRAPNMERCTIPLLAARSPLDGDDTLLRPSSDRVLMPNLKHLYLTVGEDIWRLETLLQRLDLPALESLGISGYGAKTSSKDYYLPLSMISSFIIDSSCTLKEFYLSSTRFRAHEVIDFLASTHMKSLTCLDLGFCSWADRDAFQSPLLVDELLRRLIPPVSDSSTDTEPFLPSLRSLTLNTSTVFDPDLYPERRFPWDLLLRIRPMESVYLLFSLYQKRLPIDDEETIRSLADLQRQTGLKFGIWGEYTGKDLWKECQTAIGIPPLTVGLPL